MASLTHVFDRTVPNHMVKFGTRVSVLLWVTCRKSSRGILDLVFIISTFFINFFGFCSFLFLWRLATPC